MKEITYLFFLAASFAAAFFLDKFFSLAQVIYAVLIFSAFVVLFGVQKKTSVKETNFKFLGWKIYSKYELIEQNQFLGIPFGKETVVEVQRELLSDKEISELATGKLVPLAYQIISAKLRLNAGQTLGKR